MKAVGMESSSSSAIANIDDGFVFSIDWRDNEDWRREAPTMRTLFDDENVGEKNNDVNYVGEKNIDERGAEISN
ncbi:hypothetical protein L6452_42520 [Arctium lappa]|uniref:Uncharacterized protein n=1 Tax=Arctium lappa TaxID=4217 RepID=A0ACB8XJ34_ARCLA|nr:hypothetical protein L6452_42520 [Arctium lappa]